MRTVLNLSIGWIVLCLSAMSCAAGETRTILILDATAPMSAKLGQHRKIDAVKSAIAAAARLMEPKATLSLWAFGMNPAKKCEDRGELVPLQPAETAVRALDKALGPLQPRAARAPAFGTLQAALESTAEPKDAAISAVLIAGTGDDCTRDICSEAKSLHTLYPNAKLTVLGAGLSEQAAANYSCAAKAMGGALTAVKSATELDRALRQSLAIAADAKPARPPVLTAPSQNAPAGEKNLAAKEAEPVAALPPAAPPETTQAIPQPPRPEPNAVLSAVLANGTPPLGAGVTWQLYKITVTPTGQLRTAETPGWNTGGGQAELKLPEGRYFVRAGYGYASAEDSITVSAGGKAEKTVVLNAGTIAAQAFLAPASGAAGDVLFVLSRRKAGGLEELGRSSESPAMFYANEGEYTLQASAGPSRLDSTVKVEAGKVSVVRMALNAGILDIKTLAVEGAPNPVPAAWHRLYAVGPGKPAAPLLRIEGGASRVQIPAGTYRLVTEYGNARAENTVSVAAGQTVSETVILGAGEAKISLAPGKAAKVCDVYDTGAGRSAGPAARSAGISMSFILRAGVYDVECHAQGAPAPAKQTQIHVVAGETLEAKIAE